MRKKNSGEFNPIKSIKLFGLNEYFLNLVKFYDAGKLPKVILLSGDKGIGKFTLSFHLINYILTKDSNEQYNLKNLEINSENQIYKNILNNVQDNFNYLGNDKNKKTNIEDIRNIKKKFNKTILNNLPRFTILDDVELLNLNSANALLKFIEEPSDLDYFILIYNKKDKIIETLRSRSVEIKFFLDTNKKIKIYKDIINFNNLNDNFPKEYIRYCTPGMMILFQEHLNKLNLDINESFYVTTEILLNNFKKNKEIISIEYLIFFINTRLNRFLNKNNLDKFNVINFNNKFLNLIEQYRKFNLSNEPILNLIKNNGQYVS